MMTTVREQLLLSHVRTRPDARLTDFAGEAYAPMVMAGHALLANASGLMYVHGYPGSGCSHFLAALCTEAETAGLHAILIPLSEVVQESPELLAGLEVADLVALDDVQAVAGRKSGKRPCFTFLTAAGRWVGAWCCRPKDRRPVSASGYQIWFPGCHRRRHGGWGCRMMLVGRR
jgi:hypothetical protein